MPIIFKDGCLLDAFDRGEVDVIMHCANLQNIFGSGVAKSIRERYPEAYEADTIHYNSKSKKPFSHTPWVFPERKTIINLYGQEFYGTNKRQLNYGRLAEALVGGSGVFHLMIRWGVPYNMACYRAGGDWSIVLEMVSHIFRRNEVYVYKL